MINKRLNQADFLLIHSPPLRCFSQTNRPAPLVRSLLLCESMEYSTPLQKLNQMKSLQALPTSHPTHSFRYRLQPIFPLGFSLSILQVVLLSLPFHISNGQFPLLQNFPLFPPLALLHNCSAYALWC